MDPKTKIPKLLHVTGCSESQQVGGRQWPFPIRKFALRSLWQRSEVREPVREVQTFKAGALVSSCRDQKGCGGPALAASGARLYQAASLKL